MRKITLVLQDFFRTGRGVVERMSSTNSPFLIQTACFVMPVTVDTDEGYSIPGRRYEWLEARCVAPDKYRLFTVFVRRNYGWPDVKKWRKWTREIICENEGVHFPIVTPSLAQATEALARWENEQLNDINKTVARRPDRTPMHFSRWLRMSTSIPVPQPT